MSRSDHVFYCPVCGEENKPGARSCHACGADERTGFTEDYYENEFQSDGFDLPDQDFDYDTFVEKEFGESPKRSKRQWLQIFVAVLLVLLLVGYLVF